MLNESHKRPSIKGDEQDTNVIAHFMVLCALDLLWRDRGEPGPSRCVVGVRSRSFDSPSACRHAEKLRERKAHAEAKPRRLNAGLVGVSTDVVLHVEQVRDRRAVDSGTDDGFVQQSLDKY
ncbi:hypothetical protein H310_06863 [Aphanomyces invadans]|uniref:Uncharacterized protein n=1 Tax=Aphanomyces invadans TaxID=157072 RepID=A0A024U6R0_9STRA|nr:hypothetical protein H310_06863 [Aphanomyces invadans]ETW01298.1 hypothetical protein H310_06863 [Aphanomyces invadans]|eukprot:XP_008870296.1 hypothetical protein H310_06863 [Aphanomyces invadans]